MGEFRHVGDREVHRGNIWRVVVADYEGPDGERFQRDVVRSPGAVAALPLLFDAEGNPSVVLVEQYRPPHDRTLLEIPAGMRDVLDEPPEAAARRELVEEVGLSCARLEPLVEMYPSPGMTDSTTTIYLATQCTPVPRDLHGPEEHYSRVVHLPLVDAVAMTADGRIADAKSVIAILMTELRLRAE